MRRKNPNVISAGSLRDVYPSQGRFEAKMMIETRASISTERVEVSMRNSDGERMKYSAKRWGTKVNLVFDIGPDTPDGLSIIDITMYPYKGESTRERLSFWVVKD